MSSDINPGKGSEANDPNVLRQGIALEAMQFCLEFPDDAIASATREMINTSNVFLHNLVVRRSQIYADVRGEETGEWYMRGSSAAFLYFSRIAEMVDRLPLRVVSLDAITQEENEAEQRGRQTILDAEYNIGEALDIKKVERTLQQLTTIDRFLLRALRQTLPNLRDQDIPKVEREAFLNGALLVARLLGPNL